MKTDESKSKDVARLQPMSWALAPEQPEKESDTVFLLDMDSGLDAFTHR